jgi:hypothetical protein
MLPGVMKPMTLEIISRPVYCKAKYPVQQNPRAIRPPVWYLHVNDANEGIEVRSEVETGCSVGMGFHCTWQSKR